MKKQPQLEAVSDLEIARDSQSSLVRRVIGLLSIQLFYFPPMNFLSSTTFRGESPTERQLLGKQLAE